MQGAHGQKYYITNNKQLLDDQPKSKAKADNPYRDLDYSWYHRNRILSNNCFILKEKKIEVTFLLLH